MSCLGPMLVPVPRGLMFPIGREIWQEVLTAMVFAHLDSGGILFGMNSKTNFVLRKEIRTFILIPENKPQILGRNKIIFFNKITKF